MQRQELIKDQVSIGAIYRHYKGNLYRVLTIGRQSEDTSVYVVYQGLYDCPDFGPSPVWIRPLSEFIEEIVVGGKHTRRFTFIKSE